MSTLRLLIADHAATRIGIRMALDAEIEVCAEAGECKEAIRAAMREQPDICLVGRELPGDGLAAVRGICRAAPRAAVVVIAEVRNVDDLLDAVRAGAIGYVPDGVDAEGVRRIIRAAAAREAIVPRGMIIELLMELCANGPGGEAITGREAQVLGMLRRGHTTATIAERLDIAPVTVRRHISELVHKFGVRDRSELIAAV
ncbi:MAG TPA: response regulator transcription factor [Solirubrobacteraceae bacterium]|jgi:DNA-binding NarL/FixJ family response regulator|nr:response regulator transcription factor [Solirubrobacteraceae bacterium]